MLVAKTSQLQETISAGTGLGMVLSCRVWGPEYPVKDL